LKMLLIANWFAYLQIIYLKGHSDPLFL
jgi:hypothetical protein